MRMSISKLGLGLVTIGLGAIITIAIASKKDKKETKEVKNKK